MSKNQSCDCNGLNCKTQFADSFASCHNSSPLSPTPSFTAKIRSQLLEEEKFQEDVAPGFAENIGGESGEENHEEKPSYYTQDTQDLFGGNAVEVCEITDTSEYVSEGKEENENGDEVVLGETSSVGKVLDLASSESEEELEEEVVDCYTPEQRASFREIYNRHQAEVEETKSVYSDVVEEDEEIPELLDLSGRSERETDEKILPDSSVVYGDVKMSDAAPEKTPDIMPDIMSEEEWENRFAKNMTSREIADMYLDTFQNLISLMR